MDDDLIEIQVCYALPDKQIVKPLKVARGQTLLQAIEQSGLLREAPEIDLKTWRVGVYGKLKALDTVLQERDRVEIYRPLRADPKEARRRRAEKKGQGKA